MKKAEDFRGAFGAADSGFEAVVHNTLKELRAREAQSRPAAGRRVLVPAVVLALVLLLGIGIAASGGRWGVLDWLAENRPEIVATARPVTDETAEPFLQPVESDLVTVTVREARSDGFGVYLSVAFKPEREDALALNWSVDPFKASAESFGFTPDHPGQTVARWAAAHGYSQLIRVALVSIPEKSPEKEDLYEGYLFDRIESGPEFDSYMNDRMIVEEDGSTLVMASGGFLEGREEYKLTWTAVPWKMDENGAPVGRTQDERLDMMSWVQQDIMFRLPKEGLEEATVLARYEGSLPSAEDPEKADPVTVQLIRTSLNDYYRIECVDLSRIDQSPVLYLLDENGKAADRFADSDIHVYAGQAPEGRYILTSGCRLPEELPDRLAIVWYRESWKKSTTPVIRTE